MGGMESPGLVFAFGADGLEDQLAGALTELGFRRAHS